MKLTVPRLKDLTYEDRLSELKLPTLAYRRLHCDVIETFKLLNKECACDQKVSSSLSSEARQTSFIHGH